jgi:ABC-type sugar transport system permease subunit
MEKARRSPAHRGGTPGSLTGHRLSCHAGPVVMLTRKHLQDTLRGYQFVLPALVFFAAFVVYPLIVVFRSSLNEVNTLKQVSRFVGLGNFVELSQDQVFWRALSNTFVYAAAIIISINIPALAFAIILDRGKVKGNYLLRVTLFAPAILAPVLVGITFKRIFAPTGALNLILEKLGLVAWQQNWLGEPSLALAAVILTTVWQSVGWNMVLYYARLREIPRELYEAAAIDGASETGIVRHVKIPLMRDVIAILVVINIIGGFKVFDLIYIMTRGGPAHKTEVLTSFLFYQAFDFYNWGYSSSVAVVLFIIVLFFSWMRISTAFKD